MAQFSMELRELEAAQALNTTSQVSETQLDTEAIMHELPVDWEVTFRKVMGSIEILPTRPGVDPFDDIRPMDKDWSGSASTPSDMSSSQLTSITSVSPSVIAPFMAPGLASSTTSTTPETLQKLRTSAFNNVV